MDADIKTKEDIKNIIKDIMHPAINYSLLELGIVKNINIEGNIAEVEFAFPFPTIPIADTLIKSIAKPIVEKGIEFKYKIELMTIEEKDKFMKMEMLGWNG